jgi:hypothetical protein
MWYLIMILWVFTGVFFAYFTNMAWKVSWYADFHTHFDDDYPNSKWTENIFLYSLSGIVGPMFIFFHFDMFKKQSDWYLPKSLWMIRYDRKKVESKFFN